MKTLKINLEKLAAQYGFDVLVDAHVVLTEDGEFSLELTGDSKKR